MPIVCAVVAALLAIGFTPLAAQLARAIGAVDTPTDRRIHRVATPRLGGLALLAAFLVPVGYYLPAFSQQARGLVAGAILIALVGAADDIVGLAPGLKLVGQVACAIPPVALGLTIDHITVPFAGAFDLQGFQYPVTLLWFVALGNMINFTDGMDGLAAGVSGIGLTTFAIIAASFDRSVPTIVAATMAGACLGFLVFNFHPARVFMGDSGSLMLGFVIAGVAIDGVMKSAVAVAIGLPLIVLLIPILDTSFVILKRIKHRLPVYSADRSHFHHRFFTIGWGQRRTVLALYGWCALMSAVAIAISFAPYRTRGGHINLGWTFGLAAIVLVALAANVYLVYVLEILKWRSTPVIDLVRERRTARAAQREVASR